MAILSSYDGQIDDDMLFRKRAWTRFVRYQAKVGVAMYAVQTRCGDEP
jgi:hypothetical protein